MRLGQELLDLHIGFEDAEPFALERVDKDGEPQVRRALKADKARRAPSSWTGKTMLTGVPVEAWDYRLGSRSALEWVLDQYKEKKPRDPTIAARNSTPTDSLTTRKRSSPSCSASAPSVSRP